MENIILASNNIHKIEEIKQIFSNCKIMSLNDIGYIEDIEENGQTFLENALIKAQAIHKYLENNNIIETIIADDSGLCVNVLNGEPGVCSARYSGVNGVSSENRKKLLSKLKGCKDRTAYYVCVIVKMFPDGSYIYAEGKTFGKITEKELGNTSFGYDSIFYSNDLNKTFGQATHDEKNSVSHRGRAIANLIEKEISQ